MVPGCIGGALLDGLQGCRKGSGGILVRIERDHSAARHDTGHRAVRQKRFTGPWHSRYNSPDVTGKRAASYHTSPPLPQIICASAFFTIEYPFTGALNGNCKTSFAARFSELLVTRSRAPIVVCAAYCYTIHAGRNRR